MRLKKSWIIAVLEVPVSPTKSVGLCRLFIRVINHIARSVSSVGTNISEKFFSRSWIYEGTSHFHGIHIFFCMSKKYSYNVLNRIGINPAHICVTYRIYFIPSRVISLLCYWLKFYRYRLTYCCWFFTRIFDEHKTRGFFHIIVETLSGILY